MSKSKHVKVVIRTRPTSDFAQDIINFGVDRKGVHIHIPKNEEGGYINNQQEDWDFRFDSILHNASQETVYEECAAPIIKSLLEGYNGTIMAYGQTGAGKTFTMTGATENYKHRGLIPRTISQIFRDVADRPQLAFTIRVSYLEIYNEQMVDLLSGLPGDVAGGGMGGGGGEVSLNVVEDKNGRCFLLWLERDVECGAVEGHAKQNLLFGTGSAHVKGLTMPIATSEEEALNLLFEGETNRSISEHQLNKNSSRSHCIFTIYVESRSRVESSEKVMVSKLNLVDLAGSERLSKTETTGRSLKEAMYINKSLTFLEQVVIALADKKRDHIPYRQSKTTNVLRDSLGGNCNTLMISCIWGERRHIEETISTLRFATRMMCVSTSPEINVQYDPLALIKKYEREIRELKQELSMHDMLVGRGHVVYEPYSEGMRWEVRGKVKGFLEGEEEELEVTSLRHIKEIFLQFRVLYKQIEAENEDWQRIHKGANAAAVLAGGGVGAGAGRGGGDDVVESEIMDRGMDVDKDEGVGETEGNGFGVGLAPSNARPAGGLATAQTKPKAVKGRKASRMVGISGGTGPGTGMGILSHDEHDAEDMRESQQFPSNRDVSTPPNQRGLPPANTTGASSTVFVADMIPGAGINKVTESLPPLPAAKVNRILAPPPSRAEEFENFKRGKGSEMMRILTENKTILRDKKKQAKDLAETVNTYKKQIDDTKAAIEKKKREMGSSAADPSTPPILDTEHYTLLSTLSSLKTTYRDSFSSLRSLRTDIDYCSRLVDQCRQKLMAEFETWYEGVFGGEVGAQDGGSGGVGAATGGGTGVGGKGGGEGDLMDIGERFDRLQMERMSQEDPDSVPFYNARKNTERRYMKVSWSNWG
ncbi:Kinesin-like protein kif9 [Rhizophlyctis rosea]|nr:Kinesin-like protein kif9 [Rhizophlyctis rosea]